MDGVSLLICTHNGAARLLETLRHIAAQQVPAGVAWEVLVVSNASNDNTVAAAVAISQELNIRVPFQVFDEPKPGKENALIRGFNQAAYEFITIVDDDNWLAPDYVGLVYEIMQAHPKIGVLGGRAEGAFEVTPPVWFEQFQAVYAVGPQNGGKSGPLPERQGYLYGAGSVVRQSGWRKLLAHGFHFTTSAKRGKVLSGAEDVELGDALQLAGYRLWYDERLRFKHFMFKERLTWEYLLRIGQGTAMSQLTSIIYYFVFRYPNLTEARFRQLYSKRLLWLASQIVKQPTNVYHALSNPGQEDRTAIFETRRLLFNFKISLGQREEAMRVFRQVRALEDRLNQTPASS